MDLRCTKDGIMLYNSCVAPWSTELLRAGGKTDTPDWESGAGVRSRVRSLAILMNIRLTVVTVYM